MRPRPERGGRGVPAPAASRARREVSGFLFLTTGDVHSDRSALAEAEKGLARRQGPRGAGVSRARGGLVVGAIVAAADVASAMRDIGRQARQAASVRGSHPWVGVASVGGGAHALDQAVAEARRTVELARRLFPEPRVVLEADVLVALAIASDRRIQTRLAALLDPLATRDQKKGSHLMECLAAYFDADLSASTAARNLRIHRHTLEYRLRSVEALLGRSVRTRPDRFVVELAMFARELV